MARCVLAGGIRGKEEILRLDVAVHDALGVEVVEPFQELDDDSLRFDFRQAPLESGG